MGFQNYLDDNAINSIATLPPLWSHISTSPPFCYLENFDGHIGKRWFRSALTHFYLGSFRFMLWVLCWWCYWWVCGCNGRGSTPRHNGPGQRRKMELPSRLSLGTINIVPFVEGLIYYQSMYPDFRHGDRKVLGTQPHPTLRSASTYCFLCLNLIKRHIQNLYSRLTNTLAFI